MACGPGRDKRRAGVHYWPMRMVLLVLVPGALGAQTITGRVFDASDSAAVGGVRIEAGGRGVRTEGTGTYRLDAYPGRVAVSLRMLGYAALDDTVELAAGETVSRNYFLTRVPRLLSTMVVHGRAVRVPSGFESVYRRAQASNGHLLTREQIDSMNPRDVAIVLNQIPHLRVSANRDAASRLSTGRCGPMIPGSADAGHSVVLILNGTRLTHVHSVNEVLDHMAPSSIQAVEMYNGPTSVPPNFQPACAVVAIWTRAR
jgi:hypothetical protein